MVSGDGYCQLAKLQAASRAGSGSRYFELLPSLAAVAGCDALLRFGIGVIDLAGCVFIRPQDRLLRVGLPLFEVAAFHVVKLDL